jgi:hypothetical protein
MLPETTKDRVIYLGVIPVLAAVLGSVGGALFQADSCSVTGIGELQALVQNAQLTGAQKIEFMKQYMELTDRPWSVARSVVSYTAGFCMAALGLFAGSGGFRRG